MANWYQQQQDFGVNPAFMHEHKETASICTRKGLD